jgi:hypothetical protein
MRTRGRALPFAAAIVACLLALAPSVALATTSEQLATENVTAWNMVCATSATDIQCSNARLHPGWLAVIQPPSGQFTKVTTSVPQPATAARCPRVPARSGTG